MQRQHRARLAMLAQALASLLEKGLLLALELLLSWRVLASALGSDKNFPKNPCRSHTCNWENTRLPPRCHCNFGLDHNLVYHKYRQTNRPCKRTNIFPRSAQIRFRRCHYNSTHWNRRRRNNHRRRNLVNRSHTCNPFVAGNQPLGFHDHCSPLDECSCRIDTSILC